MTNWMVEDHRNAHRWAEVDGTACPYDCGQPVVHRPQPKYAVIEGVTWEQAEAAGVPFRVPYGNDPNGEHGVTETYGFTPTELRDTARNLAKVLGRTVTVHHFSD